MDLDIRENVSLKTFCTYHTGGPARFFGETRDWQTMLKLRDFANGKGLSYMILGSGSNVLFLDEGYPGLIIHNKMEKTDFHDDQVTAEGGVNLMKLILIAAEKDLGGISGLANVPGSVGGAVYGNAGIPELWIGDVLLKAEILPVSSHKPKTVKPDYFEFGYRESAIKKTKDIVLSATLRLKPMPKVEVRLEVEKYIKERNAKQPAGNSCGSFFKNPAGFPSAGWVIEQSGCKGMKLGGAQVSPKHANFFMNTGTGTSSDILNLALKIHRCVKEKFNVNLEPEVQIVPHNPFLGLRTKD